MSLTKLFALAVLTGGFLVWSGACRAGVPASAGEADPLEPWREGVRVRPVSDRPGRHTIHSYYVCNPESPDGRRVLYYASTAADGHSGQLCVLDRATGRETVLVRDVHVEDAHRAACQQWLDGGARVAFHDVRGGRWVVAVVDAETGRERVLVRDRQLGFGRPEGDVLPIYGCHWNPGDHRDLELLDASTGAVRTALTAGDVVRAYGDWVRKEFGDPGISIFFPVLSPDRKRVVLKIARGRGGDDFRSPDASHREGLIGYDLEAGRLLFLRERWGHPAWHPDSRWIIEVGNLLIDGDDGSVESIPDEPRLGGGHPSVSPDGTLFVTDGPLGSLGGKPGEWGVVVGDLRGHRHAIVHRFDNSRGARSWRRSHPHPAFSADGRRIYYNVSAGDWTVLHVAERRDGPAIPGPR
jgi:hypothetical protein